MYYDAHSIILSRLDPHEPFLTILVPFDHLEQFRLFQNFWNYLGHLKLLRLFGTILDQLKTIGTICDDLKQFQTI